jgi:hypothetical protein
MTAFNFAIVLGICLFVKSARGDLDLGNYKAMSTLKDDIKLPQATHCTVIVLAFNEEAKDIGQSISVTVARTICTQLAGVHIATSVSSVIISLPGIYNLPSISPLLCVFLVTLTMLVLVLVLMLMDRIAQY